MKTWQKYLTENLEQQFGQIMQSVWGCGNSMHRQYFDLYTCSFMGRTIQIKYWPTHPVGEGNPVADISFYQENPPSKSEKDVNLDYSAAQSLQPGTIDGLRKFKIFLDMLHKLGIWVNYLTGE